MNVWLYFTFWRHPIQLTQIGPDDVEEFLTEWKQQGWWKFDHNNSTAKRTMYVFYSKMNRVHIGEQEDIDAGSLLSL